MDIEKLELYKEWFENYSFFGNNSFVIEEIEFLWKIINIIGLEFEYCINLDIDNFTELSEEENIKIAQSYFDNHNIDININKLIDAGNIILINEKKSENFHSDGCSYFDKEKNKTIASIELKNTIFDSLIIIHELSHNRNQPNGDRNITSDLFTEAVAYTNELIACYELFDDKNKKNYFKGFQKMLYGNYAYQLYNIYKVILMYKHQNDITLEKYNLEFNDKNYEKVMDDFNDYVENRKSIFRHSYYVFGFALTIYMFEQYKKDNNFFEKIEELNNSINTKTFDECLNIVNIKDLDDLLLKFNAAVKEFNNYLIKIYELKIKKI